MRLRVVTELFQAAWNALVTAMKKQLLTPNANASLISTMLKVFDDFFEVGTVPKMSTSVMVAEITHLSLSRCENALRSDQGEATALENGTTSLVNLLNVFGSKLFIDAEFATVSTSLQYLRHLGVTSFPYLFVYLAYR
jgi:hypothetical protein